MEQYKHNINNQHNNINYSLQQPTEQYKPFTSTTYSTI